MGTFTTVDRDDAGLTALAGTRHRRLRSPRSAPGVDVREDRQVSVTLARACRRQ
jgi:hypothetical protein